MTGYSADFLTFIDPGDRAGYWLGHLQVGDRSERWSARFAPGEAPVARREEGSLDWAAPAKPIRMVPCGVRWLAGSRYDGGFVERPAGVLRIGDRERALPALRAWAGREEGRRFGSGGVRVHCHAFREDGAWLEAVGGGRFVSIRARAGRVDFRMNRLPALLVNRTLAAPSPAGWSFSSTTLGREVRAEVRCDPAGMVGLEFAGPEGDRLYCYATELASLRLELRARASVGFPWKTRVLESEGTTHYEWASREPVAGIPLLRV